MAIHFAGIQPSVAATKEPAGAAHSATPPLTGFAAVFAGLKTLNKDQFELRFGNSQPAAAPAYKRGLEGVIADRTEISDVDPAHSTLIYRGYDIRDLVNHSNYEETAYLLLNGKLPTKQQLNNFNAALKWQRELSPQMLSAIRRFPRTAHPMDRLKAAVALLALEQDRAMLNDNSHDANVEKATQLIAKLPTIIAAMHRIDQGKRPLKPKPELTHAENFLYMMTGKKPDPYVAKVFDQTLIAYADHGFNASTTAARVTGSTQSDMFSAVVSAIGALKGPLHGGANEQVMRMLLEIGDEGKAEQWVLDKLAAKEKVMGFGHREYKTGDPRSRILTEKAEEVAKRLNQPQWHRTAQKVVEVMDRELRKKGKDPLPTNVDYPIGYIYYMLGIPMELYTPIFALARVAGWTAQVTELHDDNRLYRPKADYQGKRGETYQPLDQRA